MALTVAVPPMKVSWMEEKPVTAEEPLCNYLCVTFTSFIFHFIIIFANLYELSGKRGVSALKPDETISPSQRYSQKDNMMFTGSLIVTTVYKNVPLVTDGKQIVDAAEIFAFRCNLVFFMQLTEFLIRIFALHVSK